MNVQIFFSFPLRRVIFTFFVLSAHFKIFPPPLWEEPALQSVWLAGHCGCKHCRGYSDCAVVWYSMLTVGGQRTTNKHVTTEKDCIPPFVIFFLHSQSAFVFTLFFSYFSLLSTLTRMLLCSCFLFLLLLFQRTVGVDVPFVFIKME